MAHRSTDFGLRFATAAIKTFKRWIQQYDWKPAGLKAHLLKKLAKHEKTGDDKVADPLFFFPSRIVSRSCRNEVP
jgi:hypothetical protein